MAKAIKKKRGRKRVKNVIREPNGRISRAKKFRRPAPLQEPIDLLAIKMRAKHKGLSLADAKSPLANSFIGTLVLIGDKSGMGISQRQYDVAQKYLEIRNNYLCAKGFSHGIYEHVSNNGQEGASQHWVAICTQRRNDVRRVIMEAQFENPNDNLWASLQYLVV
ncbi:hypothetical protein [Bartonella sp. DGB2]|uniref:hypothetical protein n=1 Tax=Bartonella sp. DGB2 TaxID=3388426 RepID=UPI00398FE9C7